MSRDSGATFDLPAWSGDCSRDGVLIAEAIMRLAAMVANVADAIDDLESRLGQCGKSLDVICNELPNAGRGD
jgi:hypothetical protein